MKLKHSKYISLGVTVFIVWLAIHYWGKLEGIGGLLLRSVMPLLVGSMIAYIVNIPMSFFERNVFGRMKQNKFVVAVKRPVCLIVSVAAVCGVGFLIYTIIVPKLVTCVDLIIKELPPVIVDWYNKLDANYDVTQFLRKNISAQFGDINDLRDIIEKALSLIINGLGGVMGSVFSILSAAFSTIFTAFVSIAFSIYLLVSKERIIGNTSRVFRTYLKPKADGIIRRVVRIFDECFHRFFVGQFAEAIILGLLCFICMSIFRFPQASVISTTIGFTALIPFAGAYIGAGVGAFIIATEESPFKAFLFLIFIVILQQLENNLIYPKVVGASIGLPGVWVLAAITVGGTLGGIIGMIISVPIAAALYKIVRDDVVHRAQMNLPVPAGNTKEVSVPSDATDKPEQ